MTKAELLDGLVQATDLSKKDINTVLDALVLAISHAVSCGQEVSIPDLGKFTRVEKSARMGRNPKTGEALEIAAKKAPIFKAAKAFKEMVNQ